MLKAGQHPDWFGFVSIKRLDSSAYIEGGIAAQAHTGDNVDSFDRVFDLLDAWRHFPAYQLERRADIFFAVYIPRVVQHRYGAQVAHIIPEFPIRIGTIYPDIPINKSYKADYLVLATRPTLNLLVELKTDDTSRRPTQDRYLHAAKEAGLKKLVDGVLAIADASQAKRKYASLLAALDSAGLTRFDGNAHFNTTPPDFVISLLYIQPTSSPEDLSAMGFTELADVIADPIDQLSLRFASSLRTWASSRPGAPGNPA